MNNRKEFVTWLERQKKMNEKLIKEKMWNFDSLNRNYGIFDINDVNELDSKALGNEVSIYREFIEAKYPQKVIDAVPNTSSDESSVKLDDIESDMSVYCDELSAKSDGIFETKANTATVDENQDVAPNILANSDDNDGALDEAIATSSQENVIAEAEDGSSETQSLKKTNAFNQKSSIKTEYSLKKEARLRIKEGTLSFLGKAYFGSESISRRTSEESTEEYDNNPKLIFDIVSGRYSDIANNRFGIPMVSYVKYDEKTNKKPRRRDAFYYSEVVPAQLSTACAVLPGAPINTYIYDSIKDTLANEKHVCTEMLCLVPDYLGDFKDNVKAQIKSAGLGIVQIPRSVAAAYAYVEKYHPREDKLFVCYDYELSELCRTEIKITVDNSTNSVKFTRMARKKFSAKERISSEAIYSKYIQCFCSSREVTIPPITEKTIISTRDILDVVREKKSIIYKQNGKYSCLDYDYSVLKSILSKICDDASKDAPQEAICCILTELDLTELDEPNKMVFGLNQLTVGCEEIFKRVQNRQIIWREYLPELSLEVIKDGHFSNLQLIKKEDYQDISIESMDNEIEIPLENGSFSLPVGKEKVFIPLTREEFGNQQRDKMAMFQAEELLKGDSSIPVTLKLSYRYGDPDSYRLIAITDFGNYLQSEWCNQEDMHIDEVVYPDFKNEEQIAIKETDIEYMENFVEGMKLRIPQVLNRSFRLQVKDQDDYQESNIFDGVRLPYDRRAYYCKRKLLKNITSIDNIRSNQRCKQLLLNIINGPIYSTFLDFLINEENSQLANAIGNDKKLRHAVSISVNNFMSMLGSYYLLTNKAILEHKEELLMHFMNKGMEEYLVNASRCILEDSYGIFNYIGDNLEKRCVVKDIRNISAVCWLNPEWIFELHQAAPNAINTIIDTIYTYLTKQAADEIIPKTLKVRDVMEVALSICRLRKVNPGILNPNDKRTREMVSAIKQIDKIARENIASLKRDFVSRVKYNQEDKSRDGLDSVTDSCYLLITQLSGSRQLNLIGFVDD